MLMNNVLYKKRNIDLFKPSIKVSSTVHVQPRYIVLRFLIFIHRDKLSLDKGEKNLFLAFNFLHDIKKNSSNFKQFFFKCFIYRQAPKNGCRAVTCDHLFLKLNIIIFLIT